MWRLQPCNFTDEWNDPLWPRQFARFAALLFWRVQRLWFGDVRQFADNSITVTWLVGLVFWVIAAVGVKRTKFAVPRGQQVRRHLMSAGPFSLMIWPVARGGWLGRQLVPRSDAMPLAGVAVLAAGMASPCGRGSAGAGIGARR